MLSKQRAKHNSHNSKMAAPGNRGRFFTPEINFESSKIPVALGEPVQLYGFRFSKYFERERYYIKTYVYIRVSTTNQNEGRQLGAIAELNIPQAQIFTDKLSGKDFNRPHNQQLLITSVTHRNS